MCLTAEDDRDVARPPRRVEYRPVPGFPRHRVGSNRAVWFNETPPGRRPPWDAPRWRRLEPFRLGGRGEFVRLGHGGREVVRSVDLLLSAAFDPDPDRWARRLGRKLPRGGTVRETIPAAIAAAADAPTTPETPPGAEPPGTDPPGPPVVFRPVLGFPSYRVGSDRSVWSCAFPKARGAVEGWRRKATAEVAGRSPRVQLWRDGRSFFVPVDRLYCEAFSPPAQPAPEPLPARGPISEASLGSANPHAKLDESKVTEARRLRREGCSFADLAARYGVTPGAVRDAVSGRTWRHVPME